MPIIQGWHLWQDLAAEFPDSDWISATAAMAQYNLRNFDEAQELFEDLLESDPHRIDVSPSPASAIRQSRCKGTASSLPGSQTADTGSCWGLTPQY